MNFKDMIATIYEGLLQFVPLFRVVWAATAVLGLAMLIIALVLKKNPERKKSPWIVGGIGLLMMLSSGTQLITSLFQVVGAIILSFGKQQEVTVKLNEFGSNGWELVSILSQHSLGSSPHNLLGITQKRFLVLKKLVAQEVAP